jgi:hypothetical protein
MLMSFAHCPSIDLPYTLTVLHKGIKMKLTLRKANALQNAIQDHIKTIDVTTTIALNEFQTPATELNRARVTLVSNDVKRAKLTQALYRIRAQVGGANVTSGVSDLLAEAAYVDKRIGQLKGLTDSKVSENDTVLTGKLDKLRNTEAKSRLYGYGDTVDTGVLTEEQLEGFRADMRDLKKEKQRINDRVLELNVRTEIELADDVVSLLQDEQLI